MMSKTELEGQKPGLLLTANWDSDVGYAWWLMESYWITLATRYRLEYEPILAYPSISKLPEAIAQSPIDVNVRDFSSFGVKVFAQLRFLLKHRVKVIYFSDQPVRHWAYALFRLAGVRKIVIHDHAPGIRTPPTRWKRWVKRAAWVLPWINADICIGATEFVRERFIEVACVPAHRCHAVDNGIPTDLPSKDDIHERFCIPYGRKVIVTAARANRYKGGFFALEVFAELMRRGVDNWHYVYMGDGPDRAELSRRCTELGLSERISFPGRVDNVLGLFQTAFVAFHPSEGEVGYSLSILEYMLCGLPVLVPDDPSVCGATENKVTGTVYRASIVNDASQALIQLLEDPAHSRKMGINAARHVRVQFSLQETHRKLIQVFEQAVME